MTNFITRFFSLFKGNFEDITITEGKVHKQNRPQNEEKPKVVRSVTNPDSKYLAFDIEISKILPGDFSQWKNHRPLGISCAALKYGDEPPEIWYSQSANGEIAKKMSVSDLKRLVRTLEDASNRGWKIVTWNGLGFDFDVLAEESHNMDSCRSLAVNHIDLMFLFFCLRGYPLSLEKAAIGMGLAGKLPGMSGDKAPILWSEGNYRKVMEYVAQDVQITWELAEIIEKSGRLAWTSNRGNYQQVFFTNGLLNVSDAMQLPPVYNQWMDNKMEREDFLSWLNRHINRSAPSPLTQSETILASDYNHNQTLEINNRARTDMSLEEINAIFTQAELEDLYGIPYPPSDELIENQSNVNACPCAICRGDPGEDFVFKYSVGLDQEEWNHPDDDHDDFSENRW